MNGSRLTLVCFAVKEEARSFRQTLGSHPEVPILITGMGQRNATAALRQALERTRPQRVLTCGFAGGLRPALATGTVLFDAAGDENLSSRLLAAGAKPGRFLCTEHVATTRAEKRQLWESTGADAVEMESGAIRQICQQQQIPSATVRVVLDTAQEDLPLDFNALMTPDQKLAGGKLALTLLKAPGKLGALLRLQKQSQAAATKLAEVLTKLVTP